MKNISPLFSLVILCALTPIPSAQAAVGLSVSPANITNDYVGKVTLTMTGLSAGQTVRVEQFTDLNGNGVVDAATDGLFRGFTVTDGQLPTIGGVRNLNVPGDDDGTTNSQIRVDLDSPGIDEVFGTASGSFIYRVSDPVNSFTPVTQTFTVAQKNFSQGIRGRVTAAAGGAPLAGAFVVLLDAQGHGIGGTSTDANGNYELKTLPGSYLIFPLRPGYIADQTLAGATVVANQFTTNNQALATGAFTISGRLTDATSGAGIAGVLILGQSANNLLSISAPTDTNGNYSFAVSASEWEISAPGGGGMAQLGYLRLNDFTTNITTASAANVNLALAKATALIYGTVKDNLNNPVNGVGTSADDQARNYDAEGRSLAPNANYTLGVVAGTWSANVESDTLPAGYTAGNNMNVTIGAGQAVQANFILQLACVHLLGKVVNSSGSPQSGLEIRVNPSNGGNNVAQAVTAGDGSFDLGVTAGSWQVQLDFDDSTTNLIGPTLTFDNVTCGVNVSNINVVVLSVTAQITGHVQDSDGNPIVGVQTYAYANINGADYQSQAETDNNGNYSLNVVNGNWTVNVCWGCNDCDNCLSTSAYQRPNNQSVNIANNNGTLNFTAQLCSGVQITTTSPLVNGQVGYFYSSQFQAAGCDNNFTWTVNDPANSPPGLTLYSYGALNGTPTASGTFNFSVHARDGNGNSTDRSFSLFINSTPLQVTTTSLPSSTNGAFYSRQLNASGGEQPYSWSVAPYSGSLPPNLTLANNGVLSGTLATNGTFYFYARVTDAGLNTADSASPLQLNIANKPLLQVTTTFLTSGTNGAFYSQQLNASGGQQPYSWSVAPFSASLPPNLTLAANGVLSGTPATNGTFPFYARVTDAGLNTADSSSPLQLTLANQALQITSASDLPSGTAGAAYSAQLGATGGRPPYSWSLAAGSASLPPNLILSGSGMISGTPTTSATFGFIVQVTDLNFTSRIKPLSLLINPQSGPVLGSPNWLGNQYQIRLTGVTGQNYTVQLSTNVGSTNWTTLFITNSATTSSFLVTDPNATNKQRFYRALVGP